MSWVLDGKRIKANYLGSEPVTGTVVDSRVALGGRVKYTIALDECVELFGTLRGRLSVWEHEVVDIVAE